MKRRRIGVTKKELAEMRERGWHIETKVSLLAPLLSLRRGKHRKAKR